MFVVTLTGEHPGAADWDLAGPMQVVTLRVRLVPNNSCRYNLESKGGAYDYCRTG